MNDSITAKSLSHGVAGIHSILNIQCHQMLSDAFRTTAEVQLKFGRKFLRQCFFGRLWNLKQHTYATYICWKKFTVHTKPK